MIRTDRFAFDTNAVIYLVERVSPYYEWLEPLFSSIEAGQRRAVVSVVTEAEASVKPIMTGDAHAVRRMATFFSGDHLEVVEVTRGLAIDAARVRARLRLDLPDSIVVATAVATGCDALVGNDSMFRDRVKEISYIYLDDAVKQRPTQGL